EHPRASPNTRKSPREIRDLDARPDWFRCESLVNGVIDEMLRRRAETKKTPRTSLSEAPPPLQINPLSAVEDVRADLLDQVQPMAPRGSNIIGVIPEHVRTDAGDHIDHCEAGNALRPRPGSRGRIDPRELPVTDEGELRWL